MERGSAQVTSTPTRPLDILPFHDKGSTKGQKGSTKSISNGVGAIIASRIPKKKTKMERGSAQVTSTPARPFDIPKGHQYSPANLGLTGKPF
jgi:hypothetical protein